IIYTLNNLVDKANIELPFFADNMYNVILCGNSAMQHLFFKLRPDRLGTSPFTSITKDYVECFGEDIDLNCQDRCKIIFLPLLGGFVGGDTTAVLLSAGNKDSFKLIVDLGTNGEIAAGSKDKYLFASTACGPALEGGNIKFGMRGTIGAVEHFKIENDVCVLKVIGDAEPEGICGSGIIDITAEMLKNNIIDNTGRMLTSNEYKELNTESSLFKNLRTIDGENCFIIYENNEKSEKKIYITQKDIRQVQLAKSAIYSPWLPEHSEATSTYIMHYTWGCCLMDFLK
ncbi:MAG: ferredoxin, partial [Sedimentibacter sp.]|nr:ferredoxin [Sedimentibacter sp.]